MICDVGVTVGERESQSDVCHKKTPQDWLASHNIFFWGGHLKRVEGTNYYDFSYLCHSHFDLDRTPVLLEGSRTQGDQYQLTQQISTH